MASPNERLLYAAKTDSEELAQGALADSAVDVNHLDGLGLAAIHYAVKTPCPSVLELLLDYEKTDIDLASRSDLSTPLHFAVLLSPLEVRQGVTELLLDAGADPRIKNKHGSRPIDLLGEEDRQGELGRMIKRAEAEFYVDKGDVANDDDDGAASDGSED